MSAILIGAAAFIFLTREREERGAAELKPTKQEDRAALDNLTAAAPSERDFNDSGRPSTAGSTTDVAGFGGPDAPEGGALFTELDPLFFSPHEVGGVDGFGSHTDDNHTEASGGDVPGANDGGGFFGEVPDNDLDTRAGRDALTDQEFAFLFGEGTPRF